MTLANIFVQNLITDPYYFFLCAFVVIFSVCLHEYSHAQVALWMGDSTAADRGHLTLNPLKQMGPWSLCIFLVIGFAWGAVPVNRANLKNKYGDLFVSLAGPAANLMLFAISWVLFGLLISQKAPESACRLIGLFGTLNCVLFIFNMLPVPGLDGWHVFRFFFPKLATPNSEVLKAIMVILIFAAFMYVHYLYTFAVRLMVIAPQLFS